MSIHTEIENLVAAGPGQPIDWVALRRQIDTEHGGARDTETRVFLLAAHHIVMAMVIDQTDPAQRPVVEALRRRDHWHFLAREAALDPAGAGSILAREVAAGRLAPADAVPAGMEDVPNPLEPLPDLEPATVH